MRKRKPARRHLLQSCPNSSSVLRSLSERPFFSRRQTWERIVDPAESHVNGPLCAANGVVLFLHYAAANSDLTFKLSGAFSIYTDTSGPL